jgi:hypothetical protein
MSSPLKHLKLLLLYLGLLLSATSVAETIESYGPFDIHYYGVGEVWATAGITNQVAWANTEKGDLHSAIDEWNRVINNVNSRQIQLHVFWDEMAPNILGGSSSALWANYNKIWTGSEAAWRDGNTTATTWDTYIIYNKNFSWNFGASLPGFFEYDFRSVVLHELGHSLGWLGSYDPDYDDFGYGGYGLTTFESFLVDSMGNSPFNGTSGTPENFNETDSPVYFNGTNATTLYGGLVPIYAPTNYTPGSSLSHLDTETFPDYTMAHAIANGATKRTLSDLEIAMMSDMGWDVIPEPSPMIMISLVCCVAFWIRRRFYE